MLSLSMGLAGHGNVHGIARPLWLPFSTVIGLPACVSLFVCPCLCLYVCLCVWLQSVSLMQLHASEHDGTVNVKGALCLTCC